MESHKREEEISNESNNFKDDLAIHSLRKQHSNEELMLELNGDKEKAEESDNDSSTHGINKEKKYISKKRHSNDGFFTHFKEFEFRENGNSTNELISNSSEMRNFSATVQEWIDHLPSENSRNCQEIIDAKEEKPEMSNTTIVEQTPRLRAKLSREPSLQSNSSLDSILDSRKPDPIEIFLNLGFGGVPGVNMDNCRIPKRFLVPSKCKGGDWNEFLRRELIQAQNFECSSLGFRGLSGPSYRRPSAIVANIMEKLRERSIQQPYNRPKFLAVVKRVLNDKNIQKQLSSDFQSVLSPDSRKFLQNQGKKSPEVPRRRIIFGQKSFAFAKDGEFVEVESAKDAEISINSIPSPLITLQSVSGKLEEPIARSYLKVRRCSLQKQRRVDKDSDADAITMCFLENDGKLDDDCDAHSLGSSKCSKTSNNNNNKIPRRFFSSANLKTLDLESDFSETMRREVEKEIRNLSEKIKDLNDRDLISLLKHVKQLISTLENTGSAAFEEVQLHIKS